MNILQPKYAKLWIKVNEDEGRGEDILQPKYAKVGVKMNEHLTT